MKKGKLEITPRRREAEAPTWNLTFNSGEWKKLKQWQKLL
jgi:hypothetical protein